MFCKIYVKAQNVMLTVLYLYVNIYLRIDAYLDNGAGSMKIQPINNVYPKICSANFYGYKESMHSAVKEKFNNCNEIDNTMKKLYNELAISEGINKTPMFSVFDEWIKTKGPIALLKELCKPPQKMDSTFRDIILGVNGESIFVLTDKTWNNFIINNFGKRGFFNSLFNNKSARDDIRLFFTSGDESLELKLKRNNSIILEQWDDECMYKSYFSPSTGKKYKTKFSH